MAKKNKSEAPANNTEAPAPAPTTEVVIVDGKGLKFPESMTNDEVLAEAKKAWKKRHVGANGEWLTNSRYTPFQGRRGDELLLFVYGSDETGNVLRLYTEAGSIACGPRVVWDD